MGYIKHDAVVVTGSEKDVKRLHVHAEKLFMQSTVSAVLGPLVNRTYSFFVAPDGSKEGWESSNKQDKARDKFIRFLLKHKKDLHADWVHISFGGDQEKTIVIKSSDLTGSEQNDAE